MSYINFWRRWKDFSGKTIRPEFWKAIFAHGFICFILEFAASIILISDFDLSVEDVSLYFCMLRDLLAMLSIVPILSITVRRLHDAGYSAKSFLWLFLPAIGLIVFFGRLCADSAEEQTTA